MNLAIALAQFIMLALATMAARILVNAGSAASPPVTWSDTVATFMANQGLWFLLIPAGWLCLASWCETSQGAWSALAQPIGAGIAFAILALIVLVLAF
jgi:Aconitase A